MSKKHFLSLLTRNQELNRLLQQVAAATGARIWVEDVHGTLLFGKAPDHFEQQVPVTVYGELLGYVKGGEKAQLIADWLTQWAMLEEGRKRLGAEVLHLYREINLMFDFSEKLASTVGMESVARLTMEEAGRIIPFDQGVVFSLVAPSPLVRVIAQTGISSPAEELWAQISPAKFPEIKNLEGSWGMTAPLRVNQQELGTILLLRDHGTEFSAGDLKLLTSLAFQSASAMERAIQFEAATTLALEQQRRKLIIDLAFRDPFFRKVVAIIEQHIPDPDFSVEKLSQFLHLSPSQLQRKVLAITEKTPLQVIRDLRLQKARELLQKTDMTVAEVAFQCGFFDPSYFTRIFRKEEGVPPSQWKEDKKTD